MNPWAVVVLIVGGLAAIVAFKGTQDDVVSAILNRPYGNSQFANPQVPVPGSPGYVGTPLASGGDFTRAQAPNYLGPLPAS